MLKIIDLRDPNCKVISGTKEGEDFRKKWDLDNKDIDEHTYEIILPDGLYSIVGCFVIAAFSKSVRRLGTFNNFINKYTFKCDNNVVLRSLYNQIKCILFKAHIDKCVD